MVIEHVALFVNDLEKAKDFFVEFLGGRSNENYLNAETGFRSYFITFDGGARVEIMNKPVMPDDYKDPDRTGYSHMAFSVGSKEKVDELTAKIKSAGYKVMREPGTTGDGYYESCVFAIEDNLLELTV